MRIGAAFLVLAMMAGQANASSIVVVAPANSGVSASILVLGEAGAGPALPDMVDLPEARPKRSSIAYLPALTQPEGQSASADRSPSIVALGLPLPNVTMEKVAAIPKQRQPPLAAVTVIRGGLAGGASPAVVESAADPVPLALDPNDTGTPAKRKALKRQRQQQQANGHDGDPETLPEEPHQPEG